MKSFILKTLIPVGCVFGGLMALFALDDNPTKQDHIVDVILAGAAGLSSGIMIAGGAIYQELTKDYSV